MAALATVATPTPSGAPPELEAGATGAALDFYTNKSAGRTAPKCENPRRGLRLRASDGLWAWVRCGLNSCRYCYRLKSFERAQMVYEDALEEAPSYALTLTTKAPTWDAARYRSAKAQVLRALRAEFGRVEMLEFIEQTTGKAPRSGGRRRGHGHNLVKGIGPGRVLELERIVVPIWKRATGAWHVNVSELASAGGAVAYLTLNLALEKGKLAQAPTELPKGTRTLRATRGYWSVPVDELRARAADHNRRRRMRWRLESENPGAPPAWLELLVEHELEAARARTWELWEVWDHGSVQHPRGFEWKRPIGEGDLPLTGWVPRRGRLVNAGTGEVW